MMGRGIVKSERGSLALRLSLIATFFFFEFFDEWMIEQLTLRYWLGMKSPNDGYVLWVQKKEHSRRIEFDCQKLHHKLDCRWIERKTVALKLPTRFSIGLLGGKSSGFHLCVSNLYSDWLTSAGSLAVILQPAFWALCCGSGVSAVVCLLLPVYICLLLFAYSVASSLLPDFFEQLAINTCAYVHHRLRLAEGDT